MLSSRLQAIGWTILIVLGPPSLGKQCQRFEACGVVEYSYPPPSKSTTTTPRSVPVEGSGESVAGSGEGSGEGSGHWRPLFTGPVTDLDPLIYDEIMENEIWEAYDPASGELEVAESVRFSSFCTCPDDGVCPSNGSLVIDDFLRLSLCPGSELAACNPRVRAAPIGRVMGELDAAWVDPARTRTLSTYNGTQIFCQCPPPLKLERDHHIQYWATAQLSVFDLYCR